MRALAFALLAWFALAPPASATEERSLWTAAVDGGRLVLEDAAAVATFPIHLDREGAWKVGSVLAIGGVLFALDEEIDRAVQRSESDEPLDTVRRVGEAIEPVGLMGKTWPYYAGVFAVGTVLDHEWLQRVGGEILLAQYSSGALRNLAKLALGRRRPNEELGPRHFEWNGGTSLPSGHAASAFSAATVLVHHVDRAWATWGLYGLATAVSYQRLTSRSHWASDVWIGMASGYGAGKLITARHDRVLGRDDGVELGFVLSPTGQPGFGLRRSF